MSECTASESVISTVSLGLAEVGGVFILASFFVALAFLLYVLLFCAAGRSRVAMRATPADEGSFSNQTGQTPSVKQRAEPSGREEDLGT